MTIKAKRYTKNGVTTTLEYGMSSSGQASYYVKLDDVVLSQCSSYRSPWAKGQETEGALSETGWEKA